MLSKTCKLTLFCAGLLAVTGVALAADTVKDDLLQKNGETYGPSPRHFVAYLQDGGGSGRPVLPPGVGLRPFPGVGSGGVNQTMGGLDRNTTARSAIAGG